MTTTDKRKAQLREGTKRSRAKKEIAGFVRWEISVREEWKERILKFVEKLKNKPSK